MRVSVLEIGGRRTTLFGLGLSHGATSYENLLEGNFSTIEVHDKLAKRAAILSGKDGGHNKFLESVIAWVAIDAPRYWWQEADTYRHVSKQSESSMHTIFKRDLTADDFEGRDVGTETLSYLNAMIFNYICSKEQNNTEAMQHYFMRIKRRLPEGFLQTRLVRLDMMTLRNMYKQRKNHRLPEWRILFETLELELPKEVWEWVVKDGKNED